jgi:hypothetical protein
MGSSRKSAEVHSRSSERCAVFQERRRTTLNRRLRPPSWHHAGPPDPAPLRSMSRNESDSLWTDVARAAPDPHFRSCRAEERRRPTALIPRPAPYGSRLTQNPLGHSPTPAFLQVRSPGVHPCRRRAGAPPHDRLNTAQRAPLGRGLRSRRLWPARQSWRATKCLRPSRKCRPTPWLRSPCR